MSPTITTPAMTQAGIEDARYFFEQISIDGEAFSRLIEQLAIAETYFFREIAQFNEIRNRIVPELRALRGSQFPLRAWSAGCSSGEEAYSLAILFEQEAIPAHILATDISPKALAKAKLGTYGAWSLRGEGRQAASYIDAQSTRLVIPERLRAHIHFRRLNLVSDAYPSVVTATAELDLILCRNVLIYFDAARIQDVAKRLSACLARGGWLITGPSDPPLWDYLDLEPVMTAAGILYRRSERDGRPRINAPAVQSQASAAWKRPAVSPKRTERVPARGLPAAAPPRQTTDPGSPRVPSPSAAHIRELANRGKLGEALTASETAIAEDPTAPEFHYLRAIALLAQDRKEEAFEALRRVIYLDRSLAIAHFAMGSLLTRRGDYPKARRAFQRAYLLCATNDPDEILPLSDGERSEGLAEAARAHIEMLGRTKNVREGVHAA